MSNERSARPSDWITIGMSGMWVLLVFRNRLVALQHTLPSGCMSDVTRDITLPVEPDEAWEALIEPGWIVEEAEPGERLVFWWWAADERGVPDTAGSRVAFELDPIPGGTRVTVRESL